MDENQIISANSIDENNENDINGVKIANEVVAIIAGVATSEVVGVAGMSGGIVGGISEMLGKKNFSKGIKVDVEENDAIIEIYIIVDYGVRIPDVAWNLQNKVKTAVEEMTGLNVLKVNIHVQGVKVEKDVLDVVESTEQNKGE
ncbi:MAG: Asp23/Gls24 family envelope stress response protein [Clostridia bacterium]|nr:Asp23/Gls24 family envelope stress response protein [Clostridia bacterium]